MHVHVSCLEGWYIGNRFDLSVSTLKQHFEQSNIIIKDQREKIKSLAPGARSLRFEPKSCYLISEIIGKSNTLSA